MIRCELGRFMAKKGLRLTDMAKAVGMSRQAITHIYYDQVKGIDYATLDKLCEFFECEPGDLLKRDKA